MRTATPPPRPERPEGAGSPQLGVDRSVIRRLLAMPVPDRFRLAIEEGRALARFDAAVAARGRRRT